MEDHEYYNGVKLPDFLGNRNGRVTTIYVGDADVTEEWENWLKESPHTAGDDAGKTE